MSFERAEAQWEESMYTKYWDEPNRAAFDENEDEDENEEEDEDEGVEDDED